MSESIIKCFGIPVYTEVLSDNTVSFIHQEVSEAMNTTMFLKPGVQKLNEMSGQLGHGISSNEFNGDWILEKECNFFISTLDICIQKYLQIIGKEPNKNYIRKSWINQFVQNSFAHTHNHATTDISGVYYVKTTGEDGQLFFETPVGETTCSPLWTELSTTVAVTPQVGKMVLFPGWLNHGVTQNFTTDHRVSVSFNINFFPK